MFATISISLLLVLPIIISLLRATRPNQGYTWLIAAFGATLVWLSIFLWRLGIPQQVTWSNWASTPLFTTSPMFLIDEIAWLFSLSLVTICLATILTAPARAIPVNLLAISGTFLLTAIGLGAALAGNPLTLLLMWGALDLAELFITLSSFKRPKQSENAVIAFSVRLLGAGFIIWGSLASANTGHSLDFSTIPASASVFFLLGASLRLGVIPLNLPYAQEPVLRRGFGTTLRLVSAASSLILLARIPQPELSPVLKAVLLTLVGIIALFGAWKWALSSDPLTGRPYWIIGMGALAISASLRGSPLSAAAWGSALILAGGFIFLYSHALRRAKWLGFLILLGLSTLPFSLTSLGWSKSGAGGGWELLLLIPSHALLLTGYTRFLLSPKEPKDNIQPALFQNVYIFGFFAITAAILLSGLWGWTGALQIGAWFAGLASALLFFIILAILRRLKLLIPDTTTIPALQRVPEKTRITLSGPIWAVYRSIRQVSLVLAQALEDDGGVLWALLLLVLFISSLQGGQ